MLNKKKIRRQRKEALTKKNKKSIEIPHKSKCDIFINRKRRKKTRVHRNHSQ